MTVPVPQPVPKKRLKVEPEPGGQLEQFLVANKLAHDEADSWNEREAEFKQAVKSWLLSLYPDPADLPDGFDIPADAHGRYPAYSMTLKKGRRFDAKLYLAAAGEEAYGQYVVDTTPTWELRESTQGKGRK
jgi:hypothetical protein